MYKVSTRVTSWKETSEFLYQREIRSLGNIVAAIFSLPESTKLSGCLLLIEKTSQISMHFKICAIKSHCLSLVKNTTDRACRGMQTIKFINMASHQKLILHTIDGVRSGKRVDISSNISQNFHQCTLRSRRNCK
jgi:hypothetical protein